MLLLLKQILIKASHNICSVVDELLIAPFDDDGCYYRAKVVESKEHGYTKVLLLSRNLNEKGFVLYSFLVIFIYLF